MNDRRRGNVLIWVGLVALVAIILLVVFWKPSAPATTSAPLGQPQPSYAVQGQVVAGFPQSLILDPNAQVDSSYAIDYGASANQYTAEWVSSLSTASLFGKYKTYLSSNGWTVTNQASKPALSNVYAKNADGSFANVTIFSQPTGNEVVVSYVGH